MKTKLLYIALGAAAGSAVTYIIMKRKNRVELLDMASTYEEWLDLNEDMELPENLKEAYPSYGNNKLQELYTQEEWILEDREIDTSELIKLNMNIPEGYLMYPLLTENETATEYVNRMLSIKGTFTEDDIKIFSSWWKKHLDGITDEEVTETVINVFERENTVQNPTFAHYTTVPDEIISYNTFMNDTTYDKAHLTIFSDGLIIDEDSNVLSNDFDIFRADDFFGVYSEDNNIVYFRNEQLKVDFELTRNPGTYLEQVHGYNEDTI